MPRLSYVWRIARFTLQEAVSRRLLLAGAAISLGYLALFALGFHLAHDRATENVRGAQARAELGVAFALLTLFGVYVVNYLASFLALFLSVGAISGEIDSGTLHALLARPLRRAELVFGRWLGLGLMLAAYILTMTSAVLAIAWVIAGYTVPNPVPAFLLMLLSGVLLLTLSLCGSTFLPTLANGVIVFTLLGLAWLGGILEVIGRLFQSMPEPPVGTEALVTMGTAVSLVLPTDALWRGASFFLQSPALNALMGGARGGALLFSDAPPTPALIGWSVAYVGVILGAAAVIFQRRDL